MMSGRHYGAVAAVIGLPCEHPETAPLARCRACGRSRCHTRWRGMPAYGAIPTVVASGRRQELPQSGPCWRRKRPAQLGGYLPFRGIRSGDKGYVVSNPITPIRARQRRRAEIGHTLGPAPITALMR